MTTLRNLLFGGAGGGTSLADAGLLVLRVFAGLAMAFAHGLGKLPPSERFVDGVAEIGFPAALVFAWAAGLAEFLGGILLAFGLATRPAALFIAITMAVAAFGRHADDPFVMQELALLYLVVAIGFMLAGGGGYSADALIRGRR